MEQDLDQFLEDVDSVYDQVQALASGKLDVPMKLPSSRPPAQVEEVKQTSRPGKGQHFETYKHFCSKCFIEFLEETPECPTCHQPTMTGDQRRADLMTKVAKLQQERAMKASKKMRWENWKKTQAMLHRKTSTNYKKWDFFEEEEDEEQPVDDFIPPANDPNFAALERDIKERAASRKLDKKKAEALKEKGNRFYREGKYRNALAAYEEALSCKKDWLILYTNAALTRLKLEDYQGAVKDCDRVLEYCEVFEDGFEKSADVCFKALSRKAVALRGLAQYTEAVSALQTALTLKEDAEARTLLERSKADLSVLTQVECRPVEAIDAESIIQALQTEAQVIEFNAAGGGVTLLKTIYESKDENALKVLEHLTGTEVRWYYLNILEQPAYDKRRIGAVVLLQAMERYLEDCEFVRRVLDVLNIAMEHEELRQLIVKHSAFTKGKKFVKYAYDLCLRLPKDLRVQRAGLLLLSNLSLSVYKTPLNRVPNPGSLKSVIQHGWGQFVEEARLLADSEAWRELLALLCNLATDKAIQELLLRQQELLQKAVLTLQTSVDSLALERALGLITNCFSSAELTALAEPFAPGAYTGCSRMLGLTKTTPEISRRSMLLLVKLLSRSPALAQQLSTDSIAREAVMKGLDDEATVDAAIKALALSCGEPALSRQIEVPKIVCIALHTLNVFRSSSKLEERAANLASLLSRLAESAPLTQFTALIEPMISIIKEKTGPVRKNCGIAVARLAKCAENLEELRRVHGIEVLASVAQYLL
jgi:tetratricopeptide (TPR) repeat protein